MTRLRHLVVAVLLVAASLGIANSRPATAFASYYFWFPANTSCQGYECWYSCPDLSYRNAYVVQGPTRINGTVQCEYYQW